MTKVMDKERKVTEFGNILVITMTGALKQIGLFQLFRPCTLNYSPIQPICSKLFACSAQLAHRNLAYRAPSTA